MAHLQELLRECFTEGCTEYARYALVSRGLTIGVYCGPHGRMEMERTNEQEEIDDERRTAPDV